MFRLYPHDGLVNAAEATYEGTGQVIHERDASVSREISVSFSYTFG